MTKHTDNSLNIQKIIKGTAEHLQNLHDTLIENLEEESITKVLPI